MSSLGVSFSLPTEGAIVGASTPKGKESLIPQTLLPVREAVWV